MNLHSIVRGAINAVNPFVSAQIYRSKGYVTDANYKQQPQYDDALTMMVQKQAVTQSDLQHLSSINQQGLFTAIYTDGNWCGLNRDRGQGGDLFVIGSETWLVVAVPEIWPDWTRVLACLQPA